MSLIARAARPTILRTPLRAAPARGAHFTNEVGNNMPFSYQNKRAFGLKLAAYMLTGFSIPFVAAAYQLNKNKGGE